MTTITIDDTNPQGRRLIEQLRGLPFVTVKEPESKQDFADAAADCDAVSVDEFIGELKSLIDKRYDQKR
jgi:hypothetical protein